VVLYPRLKTDDPPATFKALGDNAVLVTTPLSTDYVFLDSVAIQFKDKKVRFVGQAGAVRCYATGKIVVTNSEGKAEIRVGGKTIRGEGGFTVIIEGGKAESATHSKDATVNVD
jgi:hypothetical protein